MDRWSIQSLVYLAWLASPNQAPAVARYSKPLARISHPK
jgi:hypothetical protein